MRISAALRLPRRQLGKLPVSGNIAIYGVRRARPHVTFPYSVPRVGSSSCNTQSTHINYTSPSKQLTKSTSVRLQFKLEYLMKTNAIEITHHPMWQYTHQCVLRSGDWICQTLSIPANASVLSWCCDHHFPARLWIHIFLGNRCDIDSFLYFWGIIAWNAYEKNRKGCHR